MEKFIYNQRVQVMYKTHFLYGYTGTVRRVVLGGEGAWVEMDQPPPEGFTMFTDEPRKRLYNLYAGFCEEINQGIMDERIEVNAVAETALGVAV
jgi:hypothetical protein